MDRVRNIVITVALGVFFCSALFCIVADGLANGFSAKVYSDLEGAPLTVVRDLKETTFAEGTT